MTWQAKEGLLDQLTNVQLTIGESCFVRKSTKKPFNKALKLSNPLELIRSDISDP